MSSLTLRTQGLEGPVLSASRAREYKYCPYRYRLRIVDKVSDPPSKTTTLEALVYSVLERLYDFPSKERSAEAATRLLEKEWDAEKVSSPEVLFAFEAPKEEGPWFESARKIVTTYLSIESPQWLTPAAHEQLVDAVTVDGIRLHEFIDRIGRSAAGDLRVVDYKTGRAPSPHLRNEALFQMRFYALLLQLTDRLSVRAQLLYLKSGQVLTFNPDPGGTTRFSDQISELWGRIEADTRRGEFMPRRNPLYNWCGIKHLCPLFEGRTPKSPEGGFEHPLRTRVS